MTIHCLGGPDMTMSAKNDIMEQLMELCVDVWSAVYHLLCLKGIMFSVWLLHWYWSGRGWCSEIDYYGEPVDCWINCSCINNFISYITRRRGRAGGGGEEEEKGYPGKQAQGNGSFPQEHGDNMAATVLFKYFCGELWLDYIMGSFWLKLKQAFWVVRCLFCD